MDQVVEGNILDTLETKELIWYSYSWRMNVAEREKRERGEPLSTSAYTFLPVADLSQVILTILLLCQHVRSTLSSCLVPSR